MTYYVGFASAGLSCVSPQMTPSKHKPIAYRRCCSCKANLPYRRYHTPLLQGSTVPHLINGTPQDQLPNCHASLCRGWCAAGGHTCWPCPSQTFCGFHLETSAPPRQLINQGAPDHAFQQERTMGWNKCCALSAMLEILVALSK